MSTIFLSHSKEDRKIIDVFLKAFENTQVSPILMEYESFQNPPWSEIQNRIQTASTLFVLLGPSLKISEYTQNWVSYEIGVADALHRQIWVFEDVNNQVLFPIPHVHHYLIYDSTQPESLTYLQKIIRSYAVNSLGLLGGMLLGVAISTNPLAALAGALICSKLNVPSRPSGVSLICPYVDCKINFSFYNQNREIRCPSCRRPMRLYDTNE